MIDLRTQAIGAVVTHGVGQGSGADESVHDIQFSFPTLSGAPVTGSVQFTVN